MPTVCGTKQEAIIRLRQLSVISVELNSKLKKALDEYNEILFEHFKLVEDGKPMSKIDMINLIKEIMELK